jgi:hypothetical protein
MFSSFKNKIEISIFGPLLNEKWRMFSLVLVAPRS